MVAPRTKLTADEYLAWERAQPTKHEFYRGEVFAMAGASLRLNYLCGRIVALLGEQLLQRGCIVLTSDQRIVADRGERYVYPDATVVCGPPEMVGNDVLVNPTIIIEVLSLSTEQNDRGSKWQSYQHLPSLTEYILIPQWTPRIERFVRAGPGWSYQAAGPGDRIVVASGVELGVDELFAGAMALSGDPEPPAAQ